MRARQVFFDFLCIVDNLPRARDALCAVLLCLYPHRNMLVHVKAVGVVQNLVREFLDAYADDEVLSGR